MIKKEELSLLYNRDYIDEEQNSLTVKEKNNQPTSLAEVEFLFNGRLLFISQDLLANSKEAFIKENVYGMEMKRNCDGLIILDSKNHHCLVYLEMKSGFNDVKKKAIRQIPCSYIKLNSILNDFTTFDKGQYKELGLIVSYPPSTDKSVANSTVASYKAKIIGDALSFAIEKYNDQLRNKGVTTFDGKTFSLDKMSCLSTKLRFSTLLIKHERVTKSPKATVDLNKVLSSVKF